MICNRIKQKNSDVTKANRILDLSLKTSTLFDGSQKSMPTGIIKDFCHAISGRNLSLERLLENLVSYRDSESC